MASCAFCDNDQVPASYYACWNCKEPMPRTEHNEAERGAIAWLLDRLESVVDLFDALRRTRGARRVVNDLINERISHEQAALEMRALNQRGKGGWLARALGR